MAASAIAAVMMTVAAVAPASAQKSKTNFDGATTSGFNAMDYRLQKPLGNPSFPADKSGFGKNFFFGFNASGALIGSNVSTGMRAGSTLGFRAGSWFSPVHGMRIGGDFGIRTERSGFENTWFGKVHAEYLLNLSNLMHGYNPDRRVEFIATFGALMQRAKQLEEWGTNFGFTTSIQTRFNVQPSMYLYLEPQVSMVGGADYGMPKTTKRLHANLALNLGIGYRLLTGRYREEGSTVFHQSKDDNLYFGAGVGGFAMLTTSPKMKNTYARAFGGKMFSSTSAIQAAVEYGYLRKDGFDYNQHLMMISLEYALNLNNAFGGYRPNDAFQMILNVGGTAATVQTHNHSLYMGYQVGLMGLFRLTPNWGIYIQPQSYFFGKKFYDAIDQKRVPLMSLNLGLRYTIGDFSRNFSDSYDTYNDDEKKYFVTAGGGMFHRLRYDHANGGNGFIGFGKRFTPVSSWRVRLDGAFAGSDSDGRYFSLHADYMASMTTGMMGYNPDRLFDIQAFFGAFGGTAKFDGPYKPYMGLETGLQALCRINSSFDVFLEPQFLATVGPGYGSSRVWIPDFRVELGLRYKLAL